MTAKETSPSSIEAATRGSNMGKKRKTDLKSLLFTIELEKKEESGAAGEAKEDTGHSTSLAELLTSEFLFYNKCKR